MYNWKFQQISKYNR